MRTLLFALSLHAATARDTTSFPPGWNGLAKTPPLGWRSWNAYGNRISQELMISAAEAVVARNRTVAGWEGKVSLCDLGYCSVGVDEGWEGCGQGVNGTQHDANGIPTIDKAFPDTAAMVEAIHQKKLDVGWYLNGCKCGEHVELPQNYAGDVSSLHDFNFDGVKIDGCGRQLNQTLYASLMRASGKNYTIENCHWGDCTDGDDSSCPTEDWCPWNWYRTSQDINAGALSWLSNLQTTTKFQDFDKPLSVPGCWAYPDMLEVGRVAAPIPSAGPSWNRAHFGAWCIVSAPLILGLELTDEKLTPILDIIGNKMAVRVNQEWAGHPGMLVLNILAPPQRALPGGNKLVVPSDSPGDFTTEKGADIGGGRSDADSNGISIRTGAPGSTSLITIGAGIVGVEGAMSITSIDLSFRYLAGYTPSKGAPQKKASTVTVQILDQTTGQVLDSNVWTSPPLGNYSWDHGDPNSPPVQMRVEGLHVPLSATKPVVVALSVANNDRNLQIPVDDKSGGMHVEVGFSKGFSTVASWSSKEKVFLSSPPFVGISPYHGTVPGGAGQLWAKPQLNGSLAVLLINHGGKQIDTFSVSLKTVLNLTAAVYRVVDVWTQQPLARGDGAAALASGNFTFTNVAPYDSQFYVLTPS